MPQINRRRSIFGGTLHTRSGGDDASAPSRLIEGHAILFNTESAPFEDSPARRVVEVIDPGAITRELLDGSDIKMNYDHDNRSLLARSVGGEGTLSYDIDDRGVAFSFEAPATALGDMILEHIRRGDLRGCSFCFSTDYDDPTRVAIERGQTPDGRELVTIRHLSIAGIYDFAITADPAYPATDVEARAINARIAATAAAIEEESKEKRKEKIAEEPAGVSPAVRHLHTLNTKYSLTL